MPGFRLLDGRSMAFSRSLSCLSHWAHVFLELALKEFDFPFRVLLHELERLIMSFAGRFVDSSIFSRLVADRLELFLEGLLLGLPFDALLGDEPFELFERRGCGRGGVAVVVAGAAGRLGRRPLLVLAERTFYSVAIESDPRET